ncbi:hypothetical protein ACTI_58380 [Actinoplanes sp. OR16]|uniref:helix-turn-helix transcriptional regulator n=1 Tax=Actinoplanes sp. OR16 TaxID=946334 RepID=UPI000F6C34A2|nr:AlpA family phage regulatory protein [Actinoplanes sp. OR16]BBH69153.1 hypothetical protein ACTI_58380 [Actinoplanes sp. OR16]
MDASQIRQRLGISRQRCYQIVGRRTFPAPYQVLVFGRVWDAAEVEAWIRIYRPHLADDQRD